MSTAIGSPALVVQPWCDVPLCPELDAAEQPCRGPLITREEHARGDEIDPLHDLVCCACGVSRKGTTDERQQAERARGE